MLYFLCCIVLCCIFFVIYFPFFCVIYFCVILVPFHSLRQVLMIYVNQIFAHTLKKTVSLGVGQLWLIHYLVICLCLFRNYLSVHNLKCLLLFLLLLLIFSLHKWYFSIIFSIAFNFHRHYTIKLFYPSFITLISHHLFCLVCVKTLDGVDDFGSKIRYTTKSNWDLGCDATIYFSVFSSWKFKVSSFWMSICWISTDFGFGPFCIIESYGGDNPTYLCTWLLYFSCCNKITSLSATPSSDICLEDCFVRI